MPTPGSHMRRLSPCLLLVLLSLLVGCGSTSKSTALPETGPDTAKSPVVAAHPYENRAAGFSLELPDDTWQVVDESQGPVTVLIFSPSAEDFSVRATVLLLPAVFMPDLLLTREAGISGALGEDYQRLSFEEQSTLDGRTSQRLEYQSANGRTVEQAFVDHDVAVIFQMSAPQAFWDASETAQTLPTILDSFHYTAPVAALQISTLSASEVRTQRQEAFEDLLSKRAQGWTLDHHELHLDIDPSAGTLDVRDRLTITAHTEGVESVSALFTSGTIETVTASDGTSLDWTVDPPPDQPAESRRLDIQLKTQLEPGSETLIEVTLHNEHFEHTVDQNLIAEVEFVGQVTAKSSWSSHVFYYPVDDKNDAAMDIHFTVPSGYTAVTGGELMAHTTVKDVATFHYRTTHRTPRQLPFGFAVGNYDTWTGRTPDGLEITVYDHPDNSMLAQQRVDVAVEAGTVFEQAMGPLPWGHVRYAHVTPIRKEMGVSLPGLILISDGFWNDISGVDLSDGNLSKTSALDLVVVADELSHQWNFYAVAFANELSEGISTLTNAFFVEARHGQDAYRAFLRDCRTSYLTTTLKQPDVAIADVAIYDTPAYRAIAFCKTALVLDLLRQEHGDVLFFSAWQKLFVEFTGDEDAFVALQRTFESVTQRDLGTFFDQWFYRAGVPELSVSFEQSDTTIALVIEQHQDGAFQLPLEVEVIGHNQTIHREQLVLTDAQHTFELEVDFEVAEVRLDPDARALWRAR